MWPCPATPLTLVLGEGNTARHPHPARRPAKDRPGVTPCSWLALCLVTLLLSPACPTAALQLPGSGCPTKGNARDSLMEDQAGDSQGQAGPLSLT